MVAAQVAGAELALATVNRNLKRLRDDGQVEAVTLPGEATRHESSGHAHQHHFQCPACQRVFDVHQCLGDLSRMAPRGLKVERREITFYGLCADRAPARARRAARR